MEAVRKTNVSVPYLFILIQVFKDKSVSGLAKSINVSRQSIHAWKRGSTPSYSNIISASSYLGVSNASCFSDLIMFCDFLNTLDSSNSSVNQVKLQKIKSELCKC